MMVHFQLHPIHFDLARCMSAHGAQIDDQMHQSMIFGASLSEPHSSEYCTEIPVGLACVLAFAKSFY